MKLPLLYIPATDQPEDDTFYHADAWGLGRLFSIFQYGNRSQQERRAALRLERKLRDALRARLDAITIDEPQRALLESVLLDPEKYTKAALTTDDGRTVPIRNQILEDRRVITAMEQIGAVLRGEPGIFEGDEGQQIIDEQLAERSCAAALAAAGTEAAHAD